MIMHRCGAILVSFALLSGGCLSGKAQTTKDQQSEQKVSIGIAEVAVDVVVRDKKGQPVKGLTASDFEVLEDGVPQQVTSSRLVVVEPPASSKSETGGKGGPDEIGSAEAPRMTALAFVFDRLAPENRPRARQAALAYLGDNPKMDSLACVYLAGLSMEVLQPLTRDAQLIKSAIERAGGEAAVTYTPRSGQMRKLRDELAVVLKSDADTNGPPANPGRQAQLQSQLRLLESFDLLEQEQQGQATINGLTAAVESLQGISGRKAVIFFSEGLTLPPKIEPLLRSVVSAASAAHVSIYAIDAAGLRTESTQVATGKDLQSRSNTRMTQLDTATESAIGPMTKELERNEAILRADPRSGLGILASQTGGFLVSDTNDLKSGLKRIDEDMHTYYVLTYAPKDQSVDGRFRKIDVKVKRGGLSVQARKGYYAINASYSSPVMEYETPALAIAASGRRATDLPFRSSALSFPESSNNGLVAALAELPMRSVTFHEDQQSKKFTTDFSIVMVFKSDKDQVVRKVSHHYAMDGPLESLESARKEDVLFYREVDLDPGRYRVQTVAYDALAKKASTSESSVEVPAAGDSELRLSSIVVIKRAERLKPAEQKESNPFHVGELLAYPNMGEPLSKATYKQLSFFFDVYPPKGATSAPTLTIELAQRGQTLAQMPAQLPAADAQGRIQYAGGLPLTSIPPGEYEMRVVIKLGGKSVSRSTRFAVQ
jgi:VWFA-related protein